MRQIMKSSFKFLILLSLIILIPLEAFSISSAARSSKDYRFSMETFRETKSMVENFQSDDVLNKYKELQKAFQEASLDFFGRNYDASSTKFYNLKIELMNLMANVADIYLERTKTLLAATTEDNGVIDIFIDYSKTGGYARYFNRSFDPLFDVKPYNEDFTAKDFHLYYEKGSIERYLHGAYFNYQEAIRIKNDPIIDYIKSRKKINSDSIDYVISRYIDSVTRCRTAKQLGLEIYKIKNYHDEGNILDKYNLRKSQLTPIFDDRVPEKFKVDAVDNVKLLYKVEIERRNRALSR